MKNKHLKRLSELHKEHSGNITRAARQLCLELGLEFNDSIRRQASLLLNKSGETQPKPLNSAKILIFDLETAPMLAYVWGLWNQNISPTSGQLVNNWFMLTWSAKWLFEDKVYSAKLTSKEAKKQDDSRIVEKLWKMIDEADIIIAHNCLKFDEKRMNTRFILNGLTPPSPYQVIDTLVHARKRFDMPSNKLDYLADQLGVGRKIKTDFSLWENCYKGEEDALNEMSIYNDQDVLVLEEVYLAMRPWIKPHPNIGLFVDTVEETCSCCGSTNLKLDGEYRTYVNTYDVLKCNDCGSHSRRRKSNVTVNQKQRLLVSTPK